MKNCEWDSQQIVSPTSPVEENLVFALPHDLLSGTADGEDYPTSTPTANSALEKDSKKTKKPKQTFKGGGGGKRFKGRRQKNSQRPYDGKKSSRHPSSVNNRSRKAANATNKKMTT